MAKVATIVGTPGMCSDDGRALTYSWRLQTNDCDGNGFYDERGRFPTEDAAREWCDEHGYKVTSTAWT